VPVIALIAALMLSAQDPAARPSFAEWLVAVRAEAIARGIRPEIVDEALGQIEEPLPVVIERDRAQAESVMPLERYIARRLTPKVVKTAREMFAKHRALLEEVGERYGVSPSIIVGVWGLESNFGRFSGIRPTVAALATLAWDPRRAAFFRGELFAALEILNRGDIDLAHMRGSWAGAMGQVQFMPSSYLTFAEDFDGDGRRDIWSSPADIFASIANYLKGHGWTKGQAWGREVMVPREAARRIAADVAPRTGTCQATRDMTIVQPVEAWTRLGVRLPGGAALPATLPDAAMVSGATKHFLVYGNYDALLDYNCAHAYAVSVGLLADRITVPQRRPASR
jgi:membrane-bound lytic murein transglycosylase B